MNGKERMLAAIHGEQTDQVPVTPHWWGVYKYQLAGVCSGPEDEAKGWALSGKALADVDAHFYETYKPDMLHLSTGVWRSLPGDADRARARQELGAGVRELTSKRAIDEYVDAIYPSEAEIDAAGIYDHVPILARRYGDEALILLNEGNPVCEIGRASWRARV